MGIGKLVTLYAHIDLDLDFVDGLDLDGQYAEKGDTISLNLYSGTVGGLHLHFEIRFYRPDELGDETFYSFVGPEGSDIFTEPSTGSWSYGYWNPDTGYGFANPGNHIFGSSTGLVNSSGMFPQSFHLSQNYPNPFNPITTIVYTLLEKQNVILEVFDIKGVKVQTLENGFQNRGTHTAHFNRQKLSSGVYFYQLKANILSETRKMLLAK
ncbi:MAG: T9SS type A sorting domain-containing protein [Candidatus Marinimicrobia bacterium]|nr:T9SS type A sorting domain-containing protein [Candidatus Neomarinimicrobiota bacterium]